MAESQIKEEHGMFDTHAQEAAAAQGKKRTRSTTTGASKKRAPVDLPGTPARRAATTTTASKARGPKDGHWTEAEHALFLECWHKYGKAWKKIAAVMKTRSNEQIRTHAQKYFSKLSQLRHCGYDGDYSMDGTRHLTKSFVSKAKTEGRMVSSWPPRGWVNPIKEAKRGDGARNEDGRARETTTPAASFTTTTTTKRNFRRLYRCAVPATAEAGAAEGMDVATDTPATAVVMHAEQMLPAAAVVSALKTPPDETTITEAAGGEEMEQEEDVEEMEQEEEAEAREGMSVYGPLDALLDGALELPEPEQEHGADGDALDLLDQYMDGCAQEKEAGAAIPRSASVADSLDSSSASASTSLPSTTAAGALPVGPDAPTHDEETLAVLLGADFRLGGDGVSSGVMWGTGEHSKALPQDSSKQGEDGKGQEQGNTFYWDGERSTIDFD